MPTWRRRVALEEYKRRRHDLEQRLQAIAAQVRQLEANVERHEELAGMVKSIEAFCQRVQQGLAEATFEQKRQLVELLIDRVVVTEEEVEIRYVIPTSSRSEYVRFCHLRLDYFDQPPMPIPVHSLPGVFERGGGNRGKPHPFQRLLAFWSFLFPNTDDPHRQRLLARSRLMTRWQERHLTKGKLELRRPLLMTMPSGKLQHTARLVRKGSGLRQRIGDLFLAFLHAPILGRSDQKLRLRRATSLEEREHIRTPISNMHPHASRLRCPNGLHLAHPDIAFALFSLAPLIPLFSLGSGNAHKGLPPPCTPAPLGSEDARPAPFARKTPVRVRCRFVPRR